MLSLERLISGRQSTYSISYIGLIIEVSTRREIPRLAINAHIQEGSIRR